MIIFFQIISSSLEIRRKQIFRFCKFQKIFDYITMNVSNAKLKDVANVQEIQLNVVVAFKDGITRLSEEMGRLAKFGIALDA